MLRSGLRGHFGRVPYQGLDPVLAEGINNLGTIRVWNPCKEPNLDFRPLELALFTCTKAATAGVEKMNG